MRTKNDPYPEFVHQRIHEHAHELFGQRRMQMRVWFVQQINLRGLSICFGAEQPSKQLYDALLARREIGGLNCNRGPRLPKSYLKLVLDPSFGGRDNLIAKVS